MEWKYHLPPHKSRTDRAFEDEKEREGRGTEVGGLTAEQARTDPMDMKNPNVAAEESMYCDSVATTPLGPGPALRAISDQ